MWQTYSVVHFNVTYKNLISHICSWRLFRRFCYCSPECLHSGGVGERSNLTAKCSSHCTSTWSQ